MNPSSTLLFMLKVLIFFYITNVILAFAQSSHMVVPLMMTANLYKKRDLAIYQRHKLSFL